MVKEHSCSECTKPRKSPPGQPDIVDAIPCKMVVIDGAVMGPVVYFQLIYTIYSFTDYLNSIVLLEIASMI